MAEFHAKYYMYCECCRQAGTGHLGKQCRYTDSAHMQWYHTATGAGPSVRVSPIMSHSSPFLHLLSLSPASSHLSIHRVLQFYLNIWIRQYLFLRNMYWSAYHRILGIYVYVTYLCNILCIWYHPCATKCIDANRLLFVPLELFSYCTW